MQDYRKKLDLLVRKIERARLAYNPHHIVNIVASSKYADVGQIQELHLCGQRAFGENRIQDLRDKSELLQVLPLEWHMIGTLQSNKINNFLDLDIALFHGLDSYELAKQIQEKASKKHKMVHALLQLNTSYESSKHGVDPSIASGIYKQILKDCPNIKLEGIMSIGANTNDRAMIEKSFRIAKDVFDALQGEGARILSLGMSYDFELAISYGSNMVRVGSLLFR